MVVELYLNRGGGEEEREERKEREKRERKEGKEERASTDTT